MKCSIQLSSFHQFLKSDAQRTLERIAATGFSHVELNASYGADNSDYSQALASAGLDVVAVDIQLHELRARFGACLEYAGLFGADWIVIPVVQIDEYGDGWLRLGEELGLISTAVRESGLKLAYHTGLADFRSAEGRVALANLATGAGDNLDIAFDATAAAKSKEDPAEWLLKLSGQVPIVALECMGDQIVNEKSLDRDVWNAVRGVSEEAGIEYVSLRVDYVTGDQFEQLGRIKGFMASEGLFD